jgi:hypothetical protein
LITQPDSADPLGAARVTLLGIAAPAPPGEVRELYLSRYENARYWQSYSDFAYYRLEVSSVYFIGGFGVMGWVPADEYGVAQPDPLADAAPELILRINSDHGEALLPIARRCIGEETAADSITLASVTAVDRLGFHLRIKTGEGFQGRRAAFPHEVRNREEALSALLEMAHAS